MRTFIATLCLCFISLPAVATAADKPLINWTAKDVGGADVKVPVDRTSILAFVRADQDQSKDALKQIETGAANSQVIVILSGPLAGERAKGMASTVAKGWSIVADTEFAASGKMNIHVWPTTLVVNAKGEQVAHLAGMPKSFTSDLAAYLEYAAGKLDDAALAQRLASHDVITDSPAQAASRHLQVAQRMIEQGQGDQARAELAEGLKLAPNDPMLQLTLARVHVLLKEPAQAIAVLDKLPAGAGPAWQINLIRGRALIAQDKWDDAKSVLPKAFDLNPDPAEAHYLLGVCFQHDKQWQEAAEQFRQAFEKSPAGHRVGVK